MKKILALGIITVFSGNLVLAQSSGVSVDAIPNKDQQFDATVSIEEFNTIVKALKGIYNFFADDKVQIGINEQNPADSLTLDIGGRIGAEAYCDANGENCINPTTWDERPSLETQPAGAKCSIRYRVKDSKYESEWAETQLNNDPIGGVAKFNSGLKYNCGANGCGVQMAIRCEPNLVVVNKAACRLRYRLNHSKRPNINNWVTTSTTESNLWQEGTWSMVSANSSTWGEGLSIQAGIECQDEKLRCQIGYRLHNENQVSDWTLSDLTQGSQWRDGQESQLSQSSIRNCDQVQGCGLQMQSRCTETLSTIKTALYNCPLDRDEECPSLCNGQISLNDK